MVIIIMVIIIIIAINLDLVLTSSGCGQVNWIAPSGSTASS